MRTAAVLSIALLMSAPNLARPSMDAEEVARVVAVAEAAAPEGLPRTGPAGLLSLNPSDEILSRHGLDGQSWRTLSRRIALAYEAQRMVDMGGLRTKERSLAAANGISDRDLREMTVLLNATRHDLAAIGAETAADRAVINPYLDRLDRILAP